MKAAGPTSGLRRRWGSPRGSRRSSIGLSLGTFRDLLFFAVRATTSRWRRAVKARSSGRRSGRRLTLAVRLEVLTRLAHVHARLLDGAAGLVRGGVGVSIRRTCVRGKASRVLAGLAFPVRRPALVA